MSELDLSEQGLIARDALVADVLEDVPSVWLPAGGYGDHAWRVVAHTGLLLAKGATTPLPRDLDPHRPEENFLDRPKSSTLISAFVLLFSNMIFSNFTTGFYQARRHG